MARPKEFDREKALSIAIDVFAEFGYEGTSTETLLKATGLARQSLYDTFGSKRALYLEALQRYNHESAAGIARDLASGPTPLDGLELALSNFALRAAEQPNAACLGVSSIFEFGLRDAEVIMAGQASQSFLIGALTDAIRRARDAGQIRADLDVSTGADLLLGMLAGLKVSARGGMPARRLQQMAVLALQALVSQYRGRQGG